MLVSELKKTIRVLFCKCKPWRISHGPFKDNDQWRTK